jgi:hypothetical protein
MDAPRGEAAFAAALPLDRLDEWEVYLGPPTFGCAVACPAAWTRS